MKWIDVNDDLPPSGVPCLVLSKVSTFGGIKNIVIEATFNPSKGWDNCYMVLDVICWCCPEGLKPSEEMIKQMTSGESQAAYVKQDDTPENPPSCDLAGSS